MSFTFSSVFIFFKYRFVEFESLENILIFEGVIRLKPLSSADNTLVDLHNSSYDTQPRPIIANYAALSSRQLKQIVGFLAHL